ncbi:MAG: nucleotidyl transferase AbiEii/AbiGii toxin family protein, partial [Gammaproteobacteria bacterium]
MAGGTALALQIGHRVSVDFDFFCPPERFPSNLFEHVGAFVKEIQTIQSRYDTLDVLAEGTKLSFFSYPYPFSPNMEVFESIN